MLRGRPRVNAQITAEQVSVIGPDGCSREVMHTVEALRLAHRQQLDLVEVDPVADPPVCKILDARKLSYATVRAEARAQHPSLELEIRDNQIKPKA